MSVSRNLSDSSKVFCAKFSFFSRQNSLNSNIVCDNFDVIFVFSMFLRSINVTVISSDMKVLSRLVILSFNRKNSCTNPQSERKLLFVSIVNSIVSTPINISILYSNVYQAIVTYYWVLVHNLCTKSQGLFPIHDG